MPRSVEEVKRRLAEVDGMLAETDAKFATKKFTDDAAVVWRGLQAERSELLEPTG